MVETYKLMSQIRLDTYKNCTNEELCAIYAKSMNQSVLAEMYCRNFKTWCGVAYNSKFYAINGADKASFVLQVIHKSMLKYALDKKCSFVTFCVSCISRRLVAQIHYLTTQSRNMNVYSLDYMKEKTECDYEANFVNTQVDEISNVEFMQVLRDSGLSDKEMFVCKLIMENPNITNIEIARELDVHRHTIAKCKNSLSNKLAFLRG